MSAVPSGTAVKPTRISGANAAGACPSKPELWGTERAARVMNLDGSSHVEISCLEITDRSSCVEQHCHGGECPEVVRCQREQAPFGDWSGTGIYARDSTAVVLRDLDVHGMALRGIHAGRLRDWQLERVRIVGNGWSGWDGDLGEDDSANAGSMRFVEVEIAWNGCAERYPDREIFGCWGQSSGGYGDGLGTAETAGDWHFDRVRIHHNVSDGLDMLYLRPPATLQVRNSSFHGNGGNQLKASGAVTVSGSRIDGNCAVLAAHGLAGADHCRAGGNSVAIVLWPAHRVLLADNQVSGQGDCLVVVDGGVPSSLVELQGNRLTGAPTWNNPRRQTCGFYAHNGAASVQLRDNEFRSVRGAQCPGGNRCP